MSRKKPTAKAEFVLFNVLYEDGTQTSNRKVPGELLGGLEGDDPAHAFIEAQDGEIAARSGRPRGPIKTIARVGAKERDKERARERDKERDKERSKVAAR